MKGNGIKMNKSYTVMELEKCNMRKEDKPLYCCFSVPQRDFLASKGIKYEICALNPNTHNMFWVYMQNGKLSEALKEWSLNKN